MRNILDQSNTENQNIFCLFSFFQKSYRFLDNVEKYGTAKQTAGDATIWRRKKMRFACKESKEIKPKLIKFNT